MTTPSARAALPLPEGSEVVQRTSFVALYNAIDAAIALQSALTAHLAAVPLDHPDLAVTTAKLADLAVVTAKLGDLAVTSAKLGAAAVTGPKLADASVGLNHLASEVMDAVAQGATNFSAGRVAGGVGAAVNNTAVPARATRFSVVVKNLHATATIEAVATGGAYGSGLPIGPGMSAAFSTKAAIPLVSDGTAAVPVAYAEDYS